MKNFLSWRGSRTVSLLALLGIGSVTLDGCFQHHRSGDTETHPHLMIFLDHTGSIGNLKPQIIKDAVQAAVSAPPKTLIEATTFGSDIRLAPFYTGIIRKPAAFKAAVTEALAKPALGRGTFGAPLLKRIGERIKLTNQPAVAVFLSDCGFDDLPAMRKEAELLDKEPLLLALYAMPAVSQSSAYTKLESALKPLGSRVRIAASADAPEALRELQATLRTGGK